MQELRHARFFVTVFCLLGAVVGLAVQVRTGMLTIGSPDSAEARDPVRDGLAASLARPCGN